MGAVIPSCARSTHRTSAPHWLIGALVVVALVCAACGLGPSSVSRGVPALMGPTRRHGL